MRAVIGLLVSVGLLTACGDESIEPSLIDCETSGDYCALGVRGWTLYFSDSLAQTPLGEQVLQEVDGDLQRIETLLPTHVVSSLQTTNLWFEVNQEAFPGGVYHPSQQWLADNGYPTTWAGGIQFGNAQNFIDWRRDYQPAMVLHELAHAWHHQVLGFENAEIIGAYDMAMAADLYDEVKYTNCDTLEAYATSNAIEYFAELTEAWFWENDFYPFNRQDLLTHDAVGASVIENYWE